MLNVFSDNRVFRAGLLLILLLLAAVSSCVGVEKVLVLTAPYATVTDDVSMKLMNRFWRGFTYELPFQKLIVTEETCEELIALWGEPSPKTDIEIMAAEELLQNSWENEGVWAVLPCLNSWTRAGK